MEILNNNILISATLTWLFTQLLKVIILAIKQKKFCFKLFLRSGGFPSTHSATTTSLAIASAKHLGLDSPAFAIATIFAFVVIYDSLGIRRETGAIAKEINNLNKKNAVNPCSAPLNEHTGHTPIEVVGGVVIGFILGLIL